MSSGTESPETSAVAGAVDLGEPRFTDLFIRRPVLASVVSLLILLLGIMALLNLPVRQFPKLTNTSITITTTYPGANAELMQGFITTPIQEAVADTEGIDFMISSSTQGSSLITIFLKLNADGSAALTEVLSSVNQVRNVIPRDANDPIVQKQTGSAVGLMYIGYSSEVLTSSQITDYVYRVVQPKLQTVPGVGSVQVIGGQPIAMRVWLNPQRMAALAITPAEVQAALRANNYTAAPGQVKGDYTEINIDANTSLADVGSFTELVVATRDQTLIRLGDIAEIELGSESAVTSAEFDGETGVAVGIFPAPDSNPLAAITAVRRTIEEMESDLPTGMTAVIGWDATMFIEASITEVWRTLLEAAVIVVLVIFLFLGNPRSTFIPIITMPLSLVGVMFALLLLGYSINLLTLLAMVLAIGLVVDDAIVVVENIHRHIEEGLSPFGAAIKGAREIATPVIAMTITLAAVYAPIGFVSGLTGTLFREFAFTLAGAVAVSGVIALTLSPMLCSKLLSSTKSEARFVRILDRRFKRLREIYGRMLDAVLNSRPAVLLVVVVLLGGCVFLYTTTPTELAPAEDEGVVLMQLTAPQYTNLDYMQAYTETLYDPFKAIPEYDNFFLMNGMPTEHQTMAGVVLKPWPDRDGTQAQVKVKVQSILNGLAGLKGFAFGLPPLPGGTQGPPVEFVITSVGDYETLFRVLERIQTAAQASGIFAFVDSDLKFNNPQINVRIERAKANELGLTMEDIGDAFATMFGDNYTNRFTLYGRSYEVIPQVPRADRLSQEMLGQVHVRTASGAVIPLSTVMTIERSVKPNALTTFQQLNSATLQGVLAPGRTLGEALAFLEAQADELFPDGFAYDFQGESRQLVEEGSTLALAFMFAIIVIFLVLAAQFESFRDPAIILIAVPLSMFGALLPLNLGFATVNIYTQIGLVTLIGLISKHGILMVEFANRLQERGYDRRAAIHEAACIRLRPILMTTSAMVVAMLPLLAATGAGAHSRFDIGLVIAAGMTVGTCFTLFVLPTMYTFIAKDHAAAGAAAGAQPRPAE